jgi:hypothetical protein
LFVLFRLGPDPLVATAAHQHRQAQYLKSSFELRQTRQQWQPIIETVYHLPKIW